jgi:hypothetical protein
MFAFIKSIFNRVDTFFVNMIDARQGWLRRPFNQQNLTPPSRPKLTVETDFEDPFDGTYA